MAHPPENNRRSWFSYFKYEEGKDLPSDARNVLLVIVTLIAAVTFQAGVNPPGGVWQEDDNGHKAGRAIYAHQKPSAYYVFLVFNTLALSTSALIIISLISLTYRFPFNFEIWLATVSMLISYGSAIFAVTPHESSRFRFILIAAAVPFVIRFSIEMFKNCRRKRSG